MASDIFGNSLGNGKRKKNMKERFEMISYAKLKSPHRDEGWKFSNHKPRWWCSIDSVEPRMELQAESQTEA